MTPSRRCTTALLEYLRFFKKHDILATEVKYNACKSDVLALTSSGKRVSEFEVKVSKADFKKDFTKTLGSKRYKAPVLKHASYNDVDSGTFTPHYFWFVVPVELEEFAVTYLEDYPDYGLLIWNSQGEAYAGRYNAYNTKIVEAKKANLIKKKSRPKASLDTLKKKIIQRATSELVRNRLKEE